MKRNSTNQFVVTACLFCLISFLHTDADAQCRYKVVNMLNDTTSFSIPCDFPLKVNTGDSVIDQNNFLSAFIAWNQNSASLQSITLPVITTSGIKNVFFEIASADFALLSDEKKTLMLASPQLYVVLP